MNKPFTTPILFLIFNRPDTTIQIFEAIKQVKPAYLYVAADGPRENKPGEAEKCKQTRDIVLNGIDWECEVKTLFREENLGCGKAVSSAITWFFENVEEGIILEDDCLPDQSFFGFCDELLIKYKENERVMMISGFNLNNDIEYEFSYRFSRLVPIWGWATWKRAWNKYDYSMNTWPSYKTGNDINYFGKQSKNILSTYEEQYYRNKTSFTWDIQWAYCIQSNNGISIMPKVNLIINIGFNSEATHTKIKNSILNDVNSINIEKKLVHPPNVVPNRDFDIEYLSKMYGSNSFIIKFYFKFINYLKRKLWDKA